MVFFTLIPIIASTAVIAEGAKAIQKSFRVIANDNGKQINLGIARNKTEAGIMKQNFMNQKQINNLSNNISKNFGRF